MKHLFLIIVLPFMVSSQIGSEQSLENKWHYDIQAAKMIANQQHKNILVYFTGSDWCPPCKVLKKDFFDTTEFSDAAKNYVLVYIDMPRNKKLLTNKQLQHNKELTAEYNKKGIFPLLKILDNQGKSLGQYSGYSMNGDTKPHFRLLKKYGESKAF